MPTFEAVTSTQITFPDDEVEQTFAFDCSGGNFLVVDNRTRNDGFLSWVTVNSYNGSPCTWFGASATSVQHLGRAGYMEDPPSGSNNIGATLTNTMTGTNPGVVTARSYSDVDLDDPFEWMTPTTGVDDTVEMTVTGDDGDLAVFLYGARASFPTGTTESSHTEDDFQAFSDDQGFAGGGYVTNDGSVDLVATVVSALMVGWVGFGINLNAESAPAAAPLLLDRAHTYAHQTMVAM